MKIGDKIKTPRGEGEITAIQYEESGEPFAVEIFYGDGLTGDRFSGGDWPGWGTALCEDLPTGMTTKVEC